MININNQNWDKLCFDDIVKLLSGADDETFFFEFKSDDETPAKLVKEVSAFSNTYGGYILLGVNDNKTIDGCTKWTEQRIHTTIHDSMTPIPNFDVKKLQQDGKVIFIIKIEEGAMPPYITNKGQIFERVSSGSFPINDSSKLIQLYNKRNDQINKIKNKIELNDIKFSANSSNNLCGYLDLGFSVTCSEPTEVQQNILDMDFEPIANYIRTVISVFSIARLGDSYQISLGRLSSRNDIGLEALVDAGVNNFIEIMSDGSVKCRIVLTAESGDSKVDITSIGNMYLIFQKIYLMIFGEKFADIFVYAHKYEQLTVLKQFVPYYRLGPDATEKDKREYGSYLTSHQNKYGNNLIIESNRIPKNDYTLIERRLFTEMGFEYTNENLIFILFLSWHFDLGYIDPPTES